MPAAAVGASTQECVWRMRRDKRGGGQAEDKRHKPDVLAITLVYNWLINRISGLIALYIASLWGN